MRCDVVSVELDFCVFQHSLLFNISALVFVHFHKVTCESELGHINVANMTIDYAC